MERAEEGDLEKPAAIGSGPRLEIKIGGMDCAEEISVLKREVGPVVGGEDRLSFDLLKGTMTVLILPEKIRPEQVIAAVVKTGMRAALWQEERGADAANGFWERRGRTVLTATSGTSTFLGFAVHAAMAGSFQAALGSEGMGLAHGVPWPARVLYGMGIVSGVWHFLPKAWFSVRRFRPDMNLLMTVAVSGAVAIGEWFEASTVAFLFALALALESWSVGRARRAVAALLELAPPTVRVKGADGTESEVRTDEVLVGTLFVVRPGERIALDGTVEKGASGVNQAPITGESIPVDKIPGAVVFAGTINGDGAMEVRSTKPAGDTTLAHIIRMVGEAQAKRAPSEQWVERFARIYTPLIMALAIVIALLPPLLAGGAWSEWIYRSLVLLVIACPCALMISTPVSIVAAIAGAAHHGVLVKGGVYMEVPAGLKVIALDKTGTLTEGKPRVVDVHPMPGTSERELLEKAAALEARSEHPLARAVLDYARSKGVIAPPAEDFQIIQGKGATGRVGAERLWIGSHRYLEEWGEESPEVHDRLEAMASAGRSVVVLGNDARVLGFIGIADMVRPTAKATLVALRKAGISRIVMLTGDNQGTARAIAEEAGVDEARAELLPADKVKAIEALVAEYGSVAMVGDGVNDAPAMGRATLGIAMGAAGTDVAIETADVALMADDLAKLPWFILFSRKTLRVIRQNIVFSLSVKATFVALTIVGTASLWSAIAADMGASLLVIFNGLRLLKGKE